MGEVSKYHVVRTLSSIESALRMMNIDVPSGAINKAITKL
jgi:aspartate aminotransferase-like enzyme